jgi:hypothetical protein
LRNLFEVVWALNRIVFGWMTKNLKNYKILNETLKRLFLVGSVRAFLVQKRQASVKVRKCLLLPRPKVAVNVVFFTAGY